MSKLDSSNTRLMKPDLSRYFVERALFTSVRRYKRPGLRCMNLGSGPDGRYAELFTGMTVDAVDIAPPSRVQPWRYHQTDAARLPFTDGTFDLVVSVEAFEHIDENRLAMAEVGRVLKPGGVLVLTTPTFWTWPFELGTHGPHYYRRQTLRNLVAGAGLAVDAMHPLGGAVTWIVGLAKSWVSLPGFKLFGARWWAFINTALLPLHWVGARIDDRLAWLPSNYLVIAHKPQADGTAEQVQQ